MKKNYLKYFFILFFLSANSLLTEVLAQPCNAIVAVVKAENDVCGFTHFSYELISNDYVLPHWVIDGNIFCNQKDTIIRFTEKREIKYELQLNNLCSVKVLSGSFSNKFQFNSVTANTQISNCSEVTFNAVHTDSFHLPERVFWKGDDFFEAGGLTQPTHVFSHEGVFNYKVMVISYAFCDTAEYAGTVEIKNNIKANAGDDIILCKDAIAINLKGYPAGGRWYGDGIERNKFLAEKAGEGIHELTYQYKLNGCITTDVVNFEVRSISSHFTPDIVEGDAPLTVHFKDLSSGIVTNRNWNFGDVLSGFDNFSNEKECEHTYTTNGEYTVGMRLTDNVSGCISDVIKSQMIKVNLRKVSTQIFNDKMMVYPNPSYKGISIVVDFSKNELYDVQVSDISGKILYNFNQLSTQKFDFETPTISAGCYFVKIIRTNNGEVFTGKVIFFN